MSWEDSEDNTIYKVVVNHEEQYSIWPADRENPLGWNDAGKSGSKQECLAYIKEVWTDMRPLSSAQEDGRNGTRVEGGRRRLTPIRPRSFQVISPVRGASVPRTSPGRR